jgi:predicted dehydrogenase
VPNITILSTAHIHTRGYLENLVKGEGGRRIQAIWDDVPSRGRRYAEKFKARFEPSLKAALNDPATDGFIICAENTRHLPLLKKALPVGKPIFCEKPMLTSVKDLKQLKALLKKYPTPLVCGYFQPFSPEMRAVAGLVKKRAFGKITRARFRNAHHAAYGKWFSTPDLRWFFDPRLAGGGAFMDMGAHSIHLLRSLFGPVKRVWATVANHSGIYPNVDDYGIAQLEFASGVLGTAEAAWTQTGGIGGLEIVGSKKTLFNNGKNYVFSAPGKPAQKLPPKSRRPTQVNRLVDLLKGKLSQQEIKADLQASLDSVAIMQAVYASSKSGHWEKVR